MTTSGSYAFDPTAASIVDELAERAGLDPSTLNHRHLTSILASINYAIRELEAEDLSSFARQDNESTTTSSATLTPADGTIDILNMSVSTDSGTTDIPIQRIPREDWFNLTPKTQSGTPTMYWVNYESLSPVVYFWPQPSTTITVKYDRLRYTQSVTTLAETMDLQKFWMDAMIYGAAARTAEKFNPERVARNEKRYYEMVEKAKGARIGRGNIIISARSFGRARTRRL